MAVDFGALLSKEDKVQILSARIAQFANEGWQHELNKKSAEALGQEEAVAASEAAIATIASAIEAHQAELAAVEAE